MGFCVHWSKGPTLLWELWELWEHSLSMFCTASSYSLLPFVLSALFYRESCILYYLHLTFYFKDSLHATSRSYTKRQCVKVQIYRFLTYRVLCHVPILLPVVIFFLNVIISDGNFRFTFLASFQHFLHRNSENSR